MAQEERSPSPPPPPPLPAAPGPRASALTKLYSDAITHILRVCSYEKFAGCFPTPAQEVPDSLENLYMQFTLKVGESLKSEFDEILSQRGVVPALNDLDRLVEEARKRKAKADSEAQGGPVQAPVPPHTLPANQLFLAHLAPSLTVHKADLAGRLDAVRSENVELTDAIMKQRHEIESLVAGLENVVADLEASVASFPTAEEMDVLKNETRGVEVDLAMVA